MAPILARPPTKDGARDPERDTNATPLSVWWGKASHHVRMMARGNMTCQRAEVSDLLQKKKKPNYSLNKFYF